MQSGKEKVSNTASAAKEKAEIFKAKAEEKVDKLTASTVEEKRIADQEKRKAKEAEAKMKLHEAKGEHAAEKVTTTPVVGGPVMGTTTAGVPGTTYPPGAGHIHTTTGRKLL